MSKIDEAVELLLASSGLTLYYAKLAVYWAIATWSMHLFRMFPILRFKGPPGTGKSSAMEVLKYFCARYLDISGKLISSASLRTKLVEAYMRTAIIEEADETSESKKCEELLAARCSPTTGDMSVMQSEDSSWVQKPAKIFGASVIHYRRALIDEATASRTITIETGFKSGKYKLPEKQEEFAQIFNNLSGIIFEDVEIEQGIDRVHDIWEPVLVVARFLKDTDWLEWAEEQIARELENLRYGQAYEISGVILSRVIQELSKKTGKVESRRLTVETDIVKQLAVHERVNLKSAQVSRELRELGFIVRRKGGLNRFIPTLNEIKRAAEKIGYEDELLEEDDEDDSTEE